ncbi:MAG: Lon protease 2 [Myxococcota bacterium]|nr:Lon protease 2 [Myxococcota bacterium]
MSDDQGSGRSFVPPNSPNPVAIPPRLPILPVRNTVLYPNMVLPLMVARERSVRLIEEVLAGDKILAVVAQRDPEIEDPVPEDLFEYGSAGTILKMLKFPDNSIRVLVQGIKRVRIAKLVEEEPFFIGDLEVIHDSAEVSAGTRRRADKLKELLQTSGVLPREQVSQALNIQEPGMLADFIATNLKLDLKEMQSLIEAVDYNRRLAMISRVLKREMAVQDVKTSIQDEVKNLIDKNQKEYYLRQQLKAIKRELGEDESETSEIEEFRERIAAAGLPELARKEADRELKRMEKMHPEGSEFTVARTYLDWLCELPWNKSSEDNLDIGNVQKVLDEDHYAMDKAKSRIIEFLSVRKLKNDMKGPILCLVGPPGVGKTSLGRSIARAMGRKFERIALGGMRDEAEIRGHRRTYVGALPGRIIRAFRRAGANNPVFMLDEIDKVGLDFRGDPTSALLEVLDPEQNNSFTDHYLDLPFDLSKVLFIATANLLDPVPAPLLDRMEVLELPGYTEEEKLQIAWSHLVRKQMQEHGITSDHIEFTDDGLRALIESYTREAGLRNLEREIAAICRKVARGVAEGKTERAVISPEMVEKLLGPRKYYPELAERTNIPGVAIGLAWTPVGGDILFIEATRMRGAKHFVVTGKLGEVMTESARAAFSYIRSNAVELGIPDDFFENTDIHIHIPAGAIPKDGPSAGITMATAIASLLTGRLVRHDTAMTGEISLRGKVMPIGGLKEKVLAASRAGITRVIIPHRNEKDLIEVPEDIRKQMTFIPVESMDQVLREALTESQVNALQPTGTG